MNSVPKQITQERILKALDKASAYLDKKPEFNIVPTLSLIGLKNALGDDGSLAKERLELAYHGFTDPQQVLKRLSLCDAHENLTSVEAIKKAWLTSFNRTLQKHWQRRDKILALQEKYKVSGLELETVSLGSKIVQYHRQVDGLKILDSDFSLLDDEHFRVAAKFCNAVRKYNMTLWFRDDKADDWVQITRKRLLLKSCAKWWAICYENRCYINQQELNKYGHAPIKSEINSLDDKVTWEFHLILGTDHCQDSDQDAFWFCANLGDEKPSL